MTIDDLERYIVARVSRYRRSGNAIEVAGHLYLGNLTTLPEGVTLTAGSYLNLGNLTSETQRYQGKTIRLRTIDGLCTRLIRARKVGEMTVWSGQYFKGNLGTDPRVYVAQHGDDYAHGDTAERALRDLRFKVAQRDLDPDELVADIKRRGVVTFNDYRLLTGACESGLMEGLRARGKDGETVHIVPDAAGRKFVIEVRFQGEHVLYI